MKFTERLYESVKEIWESYYVHPFIRGIGEGTLEVDKFKFYMIQDYIYLLDYAKVYALGVVKSETEEDMQVFSTMVNDTLNGEMSIHRSYMKRLGITENEIKNTKGSLANLSYSKYMLAIAHTGTVAELTVSLLSCMWSYQEIGIELNKIKGSTEHKLYGEWVKGYLSEDYKKSTQLVIDLVDKFAKGLSEEELNKLEEIFINTSRYEYLFWDMAYNKEM